MSAAYGALGGASFIGALGVIANGLIGVAAKAFNIGGSGAAMLHATGDLVTSLPTLGVIGGLIAAGLAFTYMSQREATELQCIRDEHMAQQNAKQMGQGMGHQQSQEEYSQNQRSDGKKWTQVTAAPQSRQASVT